MMTDSTPMGLFIAVVVVLWLAFVLVLGPKVTPYSRKQWALLMATLFALWTPMGGYLLFIVAPAANNIKPQDLVRVGALNLLIGVPLFILIGRKILRLKK